jgi:hypothetical protein
MLEMLGDVLGGRLTKYFIQRSFRLKRSFSLLILAVIMLLCLYHLFFPVRDLRRRRLSGGIIGFACAILTREYFKLSMSINSGEKAHRF